MVFVNTVIQKNGETEEFSKEKIAIMLFETMCNYGDPNLNLAEKLAFLIFDKVNAKYSKEIPFEKLDEIIKEILHQENQADLLQAYIFKKATPDTIPSDSEIKELILKLILNIQETDSLPTKLLNIQAHLNKLQNNQHEKTNKKIFEYIREGVFYPSSTFLRDITLNQQVLSGYSFQIDDTIESIFDTLSQSSIVQKYGSSISIDLSKIRSEKEKVKSINRNACGPIRIIDLFVSAKSMVGYNINSSNNLYYISIEHPDIVSFLNYSATQNEDNFAILIPDRFMTAVSENTDYTIDINSEKKQKISSLALLDLISSKIITGEKISLIFVDTINKKNPFLEDYKKFTISPVGMQPVFENASFVSGVIDVSKFVNFLGNTKTFDWLKLKNVIWDTIEFLDNTIDVSKTINEKYLQELKETRSIFLSITGFYTLLTKLDIPYNSDDAINFAYSLSDYINYYSKLKSTELAKERGPFLKFIKSKYELSNFSFEKAPVQKTLFSTDLTKSKKLIKNMPKIDWIALRNNIKKYGLRNSSTFSIIFSDFYSIANECSLGVDAIINYKPIIWINGHKFEKINKELLVNVSDLKATWTKQEIESTIPKDIKLNFPLAKDVSPQFFIRLQSIFEKNTDGVVDIKIYFTDNTNIQEIKNTIIEAHKIGNSVFIPEKLNGADKDFNTENKKGLMSL
ncbi:MAG TPA: ATP cone domain-containing protein [archaeon]|nr:ATP cone domain-containing protein [archaeon]